MKKNMNETKERKYLFVASFVIAYFSDYSEGNWLIEIANVKGKP